MDTRGAKLKERDEAQKKASQYENQVKILLNKQRDAERHARNHRLIVHGAIMELSLIHISRWRRPHRRG